MFKREMKAYIKRVLQFFFPVTTLILFIVLVMNYWVLSFSKEGFFSSPEYVPNKQVGLVLGASVKRNLEPSDILKDRLRVTAEAYKKGKIQQIIVSGDNSQNHYNEPVAMQLYLEKLGVKKDDIYLDYAGFDTYDSLYRAKHIFGVEELIIFTQDFHLKRALYIAKRLGIEAYGVQTNLQKYVADGYNNRREILARVKAFLDVEINKSKPRFLGPLVDMTQPQKNTSP